VQEHKLQVWPLVALVPPSGTEEYDGSAWTAGGNLGTARYSLAGAGTQTVGLAFGGVSAGTPSSATEEYDGTSWAGGGNLGTARKHLAGAGTQTAGLGFGGGSPPASPVTGATEEYDGTSWTGGGNMVTARKYLAGCWNSNSRFSFWWSSIFSAATEEYDGTSWAAGGNLNTKRLFSRLWNTNCGISFWRIFNSYFWSCWCIWFNRKI
jgi:hypothetical protein